MLLRFPGDLTDAVSPNRIIAQQYETEWMLYDEFRRKCQSDLKAEWIDIRGNHGDILELNIFPYMFMLTFK